MIKDKIFFQQVTILHVGIILFDIFFIFFNKTCLQNCLFLYILRIMVIDDSQSSSISFFAVPRRQESNLMVIKNKQLGKTYCLQGRNKKHCSAFLKFFITFNLVLQLKVVVFWELWNFQFFRHINRYIMLFCLFW